MLNFAPDPLYTAEELAAYNAINEVLAIVDVALGTSGGDSYFLGQAESVTKSNAEIYAEAWLAEFNANPNYAPEYVNPYVSFEYVEPEPDIVQQMQDSIFDF
jgi:hypothetical protein